MPPAMTCDITSGTAMTALRVVLAGVAGRAKRVSAASAFVIPGGFEINGVWCLKVGKIEGTCDVGDNYRLLRHKN